MRYQVEEQKRQLNSAHGDRQKMKSSSKDNHQMTKAAGSSGIAVDSAVDEQQQASINQRKLRGNQASEALYRNAFNRRVKQRLFQQRALSLSNKIATSSVHNIVQTYGLGV